MGDRQPERGSGQIVIAPIHVHAATLCFASNWPGLSAIANHSTAMSTPTKIVIGTVGIATLLSLVIVFNLFAMA